MVTLENASASLQQSVVIIAISVLELTLGSPTVKVTHFLIENYLKSQTNLAYPVSQPVCVMKKELLTKIVLLRMGNVLVDQTLLDTSVTNVPQVSLDFLTVNVSNKKLILHSNQHRGNYALSCILQLHQAVAASLLEETFIWNFEFKMANKFFYTHRNKVIF